MKQIQSKNSHIDETVKTLRLIAINSLAKMYRPQDKIFAFRLRKNGHGEILEGISRRYTAVALISLAAEDKDVIKQVLGNQNPQDVCGHLIDDIDRMKDLGEVALTTWAARVLDHPKASVAVEALRRMDPGQRPYPTVELSWALTALVIEGSDITDETLAKKIADTLIDSFKPQPGFFPHGPAGRGLSAIRSHVSCFADFVYPIQALSYYYLATGTAKAAEMAVNCAERMCQLQGPQGQWWWHFDVRTGKVVERYPVYAVHQDAMAPMALFALAKACGQDHFESIEKGLLWLTNPPEIPESLIDKERNIIWRKVARHEPNRLVRGLQATVSRMYSSMRVPGMDTLFPPVSIDCESRPYHMAWILYAWPSNWE